MAFFSFLFFLIYGLNYDLAFRFFGCVHKALAGPNSQAARQPRDDGFPFFTVEEVQNEL